MKFLFEKLESQLIILWNLCKCFLLVAAMLVSGLPLPAGAETQLPVVPKLVPPVIPVEENIKVGADFYAAQVSLMPYEGYQNDIITTLYVRHDGYKLVPFVRYVIGNYYYLNKQGPVNNTIWTSDRRTATGFGVDYKYNNYFKFRVLLESIENKTPHSTYTQDSYGLVYNQFEEFSFLELNAYLEAFYIPRVSRKTVDTFAKVQAQKSFYLSRTAAASNSIFPFMQFKTKVNDDSNFGVSGQNISVGPGYRYYAVNSVKDSFAFVAEIHSVLYQSRDLNGDWLQMLAAVQLWID